MSDKSERAKLEAILGYITDIEKIVERHSNAYNALNDIEGQYALLMCIQQIGELVNNLEDADHTSRIPVRDIVGFRNIIAHNYDGINLHMVEQVVTANIPQLKDIIITLLNR